MGTSLEQEGQGEAGRGRGVEHDGQGRVGVDVDAPPLEVELLFRRLGDGAQLLRGMRGCPAADDSGPRSCIVLSAVMIVYRAVHRSGQKLTKFIQSIASVRHPPI